MMVVVVLAVLVAAVCVVVATDDVVVVVIVVVYVVELHIASISHSLSAQDGNAFVALFWDFASSSPSSSSFPSSTPANWRCRTGIEMGKLLSVDKYHSIIYYAGWVLRRTSCFLDHYHSIIYYAGRVLRLLRRASCFLHHYHYH